MRRHLSRRALLAPVVLAMLIATAPAVSGQEEALEPADYIGMRDELSQPVYPEIVTESAMVESFDGEQIYVEITRPDPAVYGELALPTVFEASPYHGTIATRIGDRIFPDPTDEQGNMIGLTGYFAPRGYSVVMMDLRGTGRSTGCLDHLGPNDAEDLKVVIEWTAAQPWSNGRVGMTGHSYVGSTPSVAAAMDPEGLVTIAPSAGLASMYDHQFNKGVPYLLQWVGPMVAYEGLAISRDLPPQAPAIPVVGGPTGDNWDNGPNPQFGCGMQHSALTAGSGQVTGQYEAWHAARDHREGALDADIPVFMIHGVNDNAARIPAAEWFFGNRFLRPGDKVWLGQWNHGSGSSRCGPQHVNCRFDQWQYALHAWFDKHLMQRDVDTGPPVEVFLSGEFPSPATGPADQEAAKVYTADAWSEPAAVQDIYLDASDLSLSSEPPAEAASRSFRSAVNAVAASASPQSLTFVGEPAAEDTLFLGLPQLNLNASVTSEVSHLTVTLYRSDGGVREAMNYCAIQPQLRDGVDTISPVVPGQEMSLPLQCFTMAHWVPAGQHLEVEVATRTPHHATFGVDPSITVYTGPEKSTYSLPEVPEFTLFDDDVPLQEA